MKLNSKKGFTLIELMVVVGIIGVISMIAIPNFQRFQSKAKQANSKTELASIYGMEKAFFTEFGQYHANLITIGYSPDGVPLDDSGCLTTVSASWPTRYYRTGFASAGAGASGDLSGITEPCAGTLSISNTVPGIGEPLEGETVAAITLDTEHVANTSDFVVGSIGNIGGKKYDKWRINETKQLTNYDVGF